MKLKLFFIWAFCFCVPVLSAQQKDYAFMSPLLQGYEDFGNSLVIQDKAAVYAAPDTNSQTIHHFAFESSVFVLEKGYSETQNLQWYKIQQGKITGYIKAYQVASNSVFNQEKKVYYFVCDLTPGWSPSDSLSLLRYDAKLKRFTDTLGITRMSSESFYKLRLEKTALKNTDAVLAFDIVLPYCGGGNLTLLYSDAGQELHFLLAAFNGGDIGFIESACVWLPMKTSDGKTALQMDKTISVPNTENPLTLATPAGLKPNETIVTRLTSTEYELDENDEPVKNEDGSEKINIAADTFIYFHWNGKKLVEMKRTAIKH